jgi:plasminogen activator
MHRERDRPKGADMKMRCSLVAAAALFATLAPPPDARATGAMDGPEAGILTNQWVSLSIRGSAGYLNGEARELVYSQIGGSQYKVSELIWDLDNLVMAGISGSAVVADRFHLRAGFWAAINEGSGQMEDYDWLMYEHDSPWTDWSLSDVDVTEASMFDINLAVDVVEFRGVTLRGMVGYKQDHWAWTDHGVRHVYSSDPFSPTGFRDEVAEDDRTTGIEYTQDFFIPYLGAEAEYRRGGLEVGLRVTYSPIVSADDEDLHVYRELLFEESFSNGTYFGVGLHALYAFESGFFVAGGIDYQVIPEFEGDMTVTDLSTGEVWNSSSSAGISHESYMLSLSVGFSL